MRVTQVDLSSPTLPDKLARVLDGANRLIDSKPEGVLTREQMAQALQLSDFLPKGTRQPHIICYLNRDEVAQPKSEPAFYQLVPKRQAAKMSACGPKGFEQFAKAHFYHPERGGITSNAATLAYLWLINATFHAHGNDHGDINDGLTFEDYEVHPSGGPGFYVMGPKVFYVEPNEDTDLGVAGWTIPPGMLHGVLSEDVNNPALAVLRFQRQGLGVRTGTLDKAGWGWPRDEKVFGYASDAISSLHEIVQGRNPTIELPEAYVASVRAAYK